MKQIIGDIFIDSAKDSWIVIPTNVGWKRDGSNIMGAGLARRISIIFPELAKDYGKWCQENGEKLYYWIKDEIRIICAPTKPLNINAPHLSWKQPSDLNLIRNSLHQIKEYVLKNPTETIMLPLLGAGMGMLDKDEVMNLIKEMNLPDNIILVLYDSDEDMNFFGKS